MEDRTIDWPVRVLVFVVLEFDESGRPLLGFMMPLVLTKHRAVWRAEMAHPAKLPDSSPDEQLLPLSYGPSPTT